MATLEFAAEDVARVVDHALAAKDHQTTVYGQERVSGAAVMLVGDQGVYLMSNGLPADPLGPEQNASSSGVFRRFVAYAKGCDPNKDEDFYENKVALFGGDDGVELLPWCENIRALIDAGTQVVRIRLSADHIRLGPAT